MDFFFESDSKDSPCFLLTNLFFGSENIGEMRPNGRHVDPNNKQVILRNRNIPGNMFALTPFVRLCCALFSPRSSQGVCKLFKQKQGDTKQPSGNIQIGMGMSNRESIFHRAVDGLMCPVVASRRQQQIPHVILSNGAAVAWFTPDLVNSGIREQTLHSMGLAKKCS